MTAPPLIEPCPPRREVRVALEERFPHIPDLDAFCLDHFPDTFQQLGPGFSRTERINLLLSREGPEQIWLRLQETKKRTVSLTNPYRGLSAFDIEHAEWFSGRSQTVAAYRAYIRAQLVAPSPSRLLPLVGPSGCGKSSLLRAGILASYLRPPGADEASDGDDEASLPPCRREQIVLSSPGDSPLKNLAAALEPIGTGKSFEELCQILRQPDGLLDLCIRLLQQQSHDGRRLLLIAIDQFEDLYAQEPLHDDATQLVNRLLEVACVSGLPIVVLLTLRTDYLPALSRHPELSRLVHSKIKPSAATPAAVGLVAPLSKDQLRETIERPAARAGRRLDPALVEELMWQALQTAERDEYVNLALLQFTLHRLWPVVAAGQDGLRRLTELGGIGGALAQWADSLFDALEDPAEQRRAQFLFLRLVSLDRERRRATLRVRRLSDLIPVGQEPAAMRRLIHHFSRAYSDQQQGRLMTVSKDDEVMLAHETLVSRWGRLSGWLQEHSDVGPFLDLLDTAIAHWREEDRLPAYLWRGPDLKRLRRLRDNPKVLLFSAQEEFLLASEAEERSQQTLRLAVVGAIAALSLVLLIWLFRLNQKERAASNLTRSSSAANMVQQPGHAVQALVLAMQAVEGSDTLGPRWDGLYQVSLLLARSRLVDLAQGNSSQARASRDLPPSVVFLPGSGRLLVGTSDGMLRLCDVESARCQPARANRSPGDEPAGAQSAITFLSVERRQPGPPLLLVGSADGSLRTWDQDLSEPSPPLHSDSAIVSAALSSDGRTLAFSDRGRHTHLVDLATGEPLHFRDLPDETDLYSLRFSDSGQQLLTAGRDQHIRIFDAASGALQLAFGPSRSSGERGNAAAALGDSHRGEVRHAVFSRDGKKIFSAGEDNVALVWDLAKQGIIQTLSGHAGPVTHIEERPSQGEPAAGEVVTASEDSTARVWDLRSGRLLYSLEAHTDRVSRATYSPDGEYIATASYDGTVRLWRPTARPHQRIVAHRDWVRSAAFSPRNPRLLATASADGTAKIWDLSQPAPRHVLRGHERWVNSALFDPSGTRVVTAGMDGQAMVWDVERGSRIAVLAGHSGWVRYATFSADGSQIVTASADGTARVWSGPDFQTVHILRGHRGAVTSAEFSPDGQHVLTAGEDRTARLWQLSDGRELSPLSDHSDWVRHAAYSHDGRRILTASRDRTAVVWNLDSHLRAQPIRRLYGHTGWVRHAVFSPSDALIVTAGADMTARVWSSASDQLLMTLTGHSGPISTAEFSPDSRYVVTAGRDSSIIVHSIEPESLRAYGCALLRSLRSRPLFESSPDSISNEELDARLAESCR